MSTYTLTYEPETAKGWTSFYSYEPDWMIGMNSYFYTFKGGNLYRHNTNETRNNFYGVQYGSSITSVFNESVFDNKLYKTIALQGTDPWEVTIESDIQDSGFIQSTWFEKKEQVWFAFVRNSGDTPAGDDEYVLRSVNGIGSSTTVDTTVTSAVEIDFSTSVNLSSMISIGDNIYFGHPTPSFCGQITEINVDLPNGVNQLIVNVPEDGTLPPSNTEYFFYIKNAVAESHGILGHYGLFTMTNNNTDQVELFAVQSDIMKSYP